MCLHLIGLQMVLVRVQVSGSGDENVSRSHRDGHLYGFISSRSLREGRSTRQIEEL